MRAACPRTLRPRTLVMIMQSLEFARPWLECVRVHQWVLACSLLCDLQLDAGDVAGEVLLQCKSAMSGTSVQVLSLSKMIMHDLIAHTFVFPFLFSFSTTIQMFETFAFACEREDDEDVFLTQSSYLSSSTTHESIQSF